MAPSSSKPAADPAAIVAPGPGHRRALLAILLLAFSLRVGWVLLAATEPAEGRLFDSIWYHVSARMLAAGRGIVRIDGTPTAQWPPLYPLLLAAVYRVSDDSILLGKLANAVFGTLTCLFTYLLGRRLVGPSAGLLAAALVAACPGNIFFSAFLMSEVAFGAIFTGAALLFATWNQRSPAVRERRWIAFGVVLGLASLTRGTAIVWLAVPAAVWWAASRSLRTTLLRTAFATVGLILAIAPWTVRNAVQMGSPVLISTNVGMVLANSHSPWETGRPSLEVLVYQRKFRKRYEHVPFPRREVEVSRAFSREALRYMFTHPAHEIRLWPKRLVWLFAHDHVGLELGRRARGEKQDAPYFSPGWHRLLAVVADGYFFALLALGLVGFGRLLRAPDRTALLVPLTVVVLTLLHVVPFGSNPRYHFPMIPFLAVSAAGLLPGLVERRRAGRAAAGDTA